MDGKNKSLVFLSYLQSDYSRSGVYFDGLGEEVSAYVSIRSTLFSAIRDLWRLRKSTNLKDKAILVMSPSHKITLLARVVLGKEIILDAGWALSEAAISPKGLGLRQLKVLKNFFIDFISFHSAKIVILESEQEAGYVAKKFLISPRKLRAVFTGLNELNFQSIEKHFNTQKQARLQVLFRGKINEEAGIENILAATLMLEKEPIDFHIVTNKNLSNYKYSMHTKIVSHYINSNEMADFYQRSDLCLGQFSENERLGRTIPHKAFESLYFARCYLTTRTIPLQSMCISQNEMFFCDSSRPQDLVQSLLLLEKNRDLVREIGSNGHALYQSQMRQSHLANLVKEICFEEFD